MHDTFPATLTDTYDADGQPTRPETPVRLSAGSLKPLLKTFTGKLQQVPPPVSAKKVGGVPLTSSHAETCR